MESGKDKYNSLHNNTTRDNNNDKAAAGNCVHHYSGAWYLLYYYDNKLWCLHGIIHVLIHISMHGCYDPANSHDWKGWYYSLEFTEKKTICKK